MGADVAGFCGGSSPYRNHMIFNIFRNRENSIMNTSKNQRRGVVVGVSVLAGAAAVALSVVGITQYEDVTVQQDVALVNAADLAHEALISAQTSINDQTFLSNVVAEQQSIYYYATEPTTAGGLGLNASQLFPGNTATPADEATSLFNGAFTRFEEANLVSQAGMQAQFDHMVGVNQTEGIGGVAPGTDGGSPGGYETAIADSLYGNLSGTGIDPTSALGVDLQALAPGSDVLMSASGFSDALSTLHDSLMQSAFTDL
ncbi:MAG: hypothetical protein ABI307_08335, partial [Mycobacterium sp.]